MLEEFDHKVMERSASIEKSHLRFLSVRSSRGLTTAITTTSGGKNILALWSFNENHRAIAVSNEFRSYRITSSNKNISTVLLEQSDSAFRFLDVFCSIDGMGIVIIVASTHNIYRYELRKTTGAKHSFEVHNMIDTYCSSACQSICLDRWGELSAYVQDDHCISIRSEELRRLITIRSLDYLRSQFATAVSSSGAAATVIAVEFSSTAEYRLIIVCFECGVVLGYDIHSGSLVLSFGTLSSISSVLTSTHCPCLLLVEDGQSDLAKQTRSRNFYIIIAYRDGKIKIFEIFRKSAISAAEANEDCVFDHRESLSYDMTREMRFQSSSSAPGGLDSLPLAMHFIPPTLQFTGDSSAPAKSHDDFLSIQHAHLCVVTAGSIVILRLWPLEVVRFVPSSSPQLPESIRSACIGIYTPPPRVDDVSHSKRWVYDEDDDCEDRKCSAFLEIHTIFSFSDRSVSTFRAPLFSTSERVEFSTGKIEPEEILSVDYAVKRTSMESVYMDASVPLSFFMPSKYAEGTASNRYNPHDDDEQQQQQEAGAVKYKLNTKMKPLDTPLAMKGATPYPARFDWETPLKDKNGRHIDQPVTFHTKIKSSGYGQVSNDPLVRKKKQHLQQRQAAASNKTRSLSAPRQRSDIAKEKNKMVQYPVHCSLIAHHQPRDDFPPGGKPSGSNQHPAIFNVCYSADGQQLALASADTALLSIKLPVRANAKEVSAYLGHNNRIQSVCFSHQKYPSSISASTATSPHPMLLSASADGSARLWQHGRMEYPLLLFSHHQFNPGSSTSAALTLDSQSSKLKSSVNGSSIIRNKPFATPVNSANFFYMDKFIILSIKSAVLMYTYDLTWSQQFNDLKFLPSAAPSVASQSAAGRYKLVQEWTGYSVSAVSCVNAVQSPIILAATSDKKLLVLDAAVGLVAREIPSPHERSIHSIALPCPSVHIPLLLDVYNIFATSATDNAITLWDIRAPQSVARYTSHVNRREPVQAAVSPCLRYIATGSEDRTARVVDVRTGREMAKLAGQHGDVVSSVAFHPLTAQLATASYDGTVKFYRDGAA